MPGTDRRPEGGFIALLRRGWQGDLATPGRDSWYYTDDRRPHLHPIFPAAACAAAVAASQTETSHAVSRLDTMQPTGVVYCSSFRSTFRDGDM